MLLVVVLATTGSIIGEARATELPGADGVPVAVREWMRASPAWADFTRAVDDSILGLREDLHECRRQRWIERVECAAAKRESSKAGVSRGSTWWGFLAGAAAASAAFVFF